MTSLHLVALCTDKCASIYKTSSAPTRSSHRSLKTEEDADVVGVVQTSVEISVVANLHGNMIGDLGQLNDFAALGRPVHRQVREYLQNVFRADTKFPQVLVAVRSLQTKRMRSSSMHDHRLQSQLPLVRIALFFSFLQTSRTLIHHGFLAPDSQELAVLTRQHPVLPLVRIALR
jgi:hypothetical protein